MRAATSSLPPGRLDPSQQRAADLVDADDVTGLTQRRQQYLGRGDPLGLVGRGDFYGAAGGRDRGGDRATRQCPAGILGQIPRGLGGAAGLDRQMGRDLEQIGRAPAGVIEEIVQRRAGETRPLRLEHLREDRVDGQGVTEAKPVAAGVLYQLKLDRVRQRLEDARAAHVRHGRQVRPIEIPAEHRGGPHHHPLFRRGQLREPLAHGLRERKRDVHGLEPAAQLPARVGPDQGSGADDAREQLLDQERDPLGASLEHAGELGRNVGRDRPPDTMPPPRPRRPEGAARAL